MRKPKHTDRRHRRRAHKSQAQRGGTEKARRATPARWSRDVTRSSNALDLESKVFTKGKPADIARSLKRSAEASTRRKGAPFQSAMSMLTFYINRAGKNLSATRLGILNRTKDALRKAFGR